MILRRAENLSTTDNVRLEDDKLWNVSLVELSDESVRVRFTRMNGEVLDRELLKDDLVRLAL